MKLITVFYFGTALFSFSFGMSESLEKLIDAVNGKEDGQFGYDDRMIAAWPGLESEEGLNEILDLVLQKGRNENYPIGMNILDVMRFPRDKIIGILYDKIKHKQTVEDGLGRAFGVAQYYTDDPRIFSYLVSFINDMRSAGRRTPMLTADYDSVTPRICDVAADIIRDGLKKRGLLKPGDPEWGESGGASSYENADRALLLLKEFLIKNQLMTKEQSLPRPKKVKEMSSPSIDHTSESRAQMREPRRPDPVIESKQQISPWLWIWIGIVAIGGTLGWNFIKRRS